MTLQAELRASLATRKRVQASVSAMLTTAMEQLSQLSQAEEASVNVDDIIGAVDLAMPALTAASAPVGNFELPAASPSSAEQTEEWTFAAPVAGSTETPAVSQPSGVSPAQEASPPPASEVNQQPDDEGGEAAAVASEEVVSAQAAPSQGNEALLNDLM